MEEAREAEDNFTEATDKILEPKAFQKFVRENVEEFPLGFLSLQFPKDSVVVAEGLKAEELNGQQGTVSQYSRDRVGIQFPGKNVTAIRPERLRLLQEAPEPAAKRHMGVKQTEERQRDLERQEALQISKRFHECLFEDTFPEMGDLHLFGLGCDYKARATEVLAVWQGLAKHMDFKAEQIADALIKGNMKERFKDCDIGGDTHTKHNGPSDEVVLHGGSTLDQSSMSDIHMSMHFDMIQYVCIYMYIHIQCILYFIYTHMHHILNKYFMPGTSCCDQGFHCRTLKGMDSRTGRLQNSKFDLCQGSYFCQFCSNRMGRTLIFNGPAWGPRGICLK